jgi:hypothetical protein
MRNTLALLAAGVLAVAGLGWYLGWYQVKSTPLPDGHREIKIDVNGQKIAEDVNKEIKQGSQKLDEILHSKGGPQSSVAPTGVVPAVVTPTARPDGVAPSRFRVEGGVLIDTEGVSLPVPVK